MTEHVAFRGDSADNQSVAKKQVTTTFQPDPAIIEALKQQAIEQERSVSWLINHYLRKSLEREGLLRPKEKRGKPEA